MPNLPLAMVPGHVDVQTNDELRANVLDVTVDDVIRNLTEQPLQAQAIQEPDPREILFEGTYEEMFNSLNKIKDLSGDTEIYCGHEYTLQNSKFCIYHDSKNLNHKKKIIEIEEKVRKGLPTIPSILKDEIKCNIFLKAKDLESFSKLRDLKDNF